MAGLFGFIVIGIGYVIVSNKNEQIQRLKRDKPFLNLIIIVIISNLFGSLLMFMFSICMPLSCKFFILNYIINIIINF